MAKSVKIFGTLDVGDSISQDGKKSASLNTRDGFIVLERDFKIKDPTGRLNPFVKDSLFDLNPWRRTLIEEYEDSQRIFVGSIKNLKFVKDNKGRTVEVKASESLALLLEFMVEETDVHDREAGTPYSYQKVAKYTNVAENYVRVYGGYTKVPLPAYVFFDNRPSPRYQILETVEESGKTVAIKLDRGLEIPINQNARMRISIPLVKTIPELVKRSLLTAGFPEDFFDSSFEELASKEFGFDAWVFVTFEHQIQFKKYLNDLLYMGNMYLLNRDGKVGIIKGLTYDGTEPVRGHITPSEIIPPYSIESDDSNLVAGFDCIYKSGDVTVDKYGESAPQEYLNKYGALKLYKPVDAKSMSLNEYTYLYGSYDSAVHYGRAFLEENKAPKYVLKGKMKRFFSGTDLSIDYGLANRYLVSCNFDFNSYQQEPAAVYRFSQNGKFSPADVELVLLNWPIPDMARETIDIRPPRIGKIIGTLNSITVILPYLGDYELHAEVFEYNAIESRGNFVFSRAIGNVFVEVAGKCDIVFIPVVGGFMGRINYIRFFLQKQYNSKKTKLFQVEPSTKIVVPGVTGCS